MYVYQADTYCDSCGASIIGKLLTTKQRTVDDSDTWPQHHLSNHESDYVDHCASGAKCLEHIDLQDYGLPQFGTLYGAEERYVGVILNDDLTTEGWDSLDWIISAPESSKTGYQVALHNLWRDTFNVQ